MKKEKKFLITSTIVLGILILIPVLVYLSHFNEQEVSSDPSDWGTLGDYLGGILNPIISLASLVVLGYLTYLVSEQTSKKNKGLFIFQKRLDAYEDLTKHFKEINMIYHGISKVLTQIKSHTSLPIEQQVSRFERTFQELSKVNSAYTNFYYTLFSFSVKYGHLFEYEFDCEEYQELLREVKLLSDNYDGIVRNIIERNELKLEEALYPSENYQKLLVNVLNKIRDEVLPKNN